MKRIFTLGVNIDGSLKVKTYTLVITSCETSSNSKGQIKEEEQPSSNHVTIQEVNDLEAKVKPVDALRKDS